MLINSRMFFEIVPARVSPGPIRVVWTALKNQWMTLWGWMICHLPKEKQWQPTPVLLPGKSQGWRSLVVHGVAKSQTQLSGFTFTFRFHALEKAMATHSSVLAWRIPGIEEPGGLPSVGPHRVGYDCSDLAAAAGRSHLHWVKSLTQMEPEWEDKSMVQTLE